jgi:hypothetical protein
MRTIDAVWDDQGVADQDLKRMADAAGRIVTLTEKRESEKAAGIEWLKTRRNLVGLSAVARLLEMDMANLRNVIDGKRQPSRTLLSKVKKHLSVV